MHASKRITILAFGLWLASFAISGLFTPLQIVYVARRDFSELQRILAALDGQVGTSRIMLIGSSPVQIGLSATEIERATGIASFNLGVGDSVEFFQDYVDVILPHVRKGDVVVVSNPSWVDKERPALPPGCVSRLTVDCIAWRFHSLPHLNLLVYYSIRPILLDALGFTSNVARDSRGDANAPVPGGTYRAIDPMPPPSAGLVVDLAQMTQLIEKFRNRYACPLLVLGPVFVRDKERELWVDRLEALKNAAYKRGLSRYFLGDDIAQTDRAKFADSPEHPSMGGGAEWTRKIIDRLQDSTMGPCVAITAR